MNTPTKNTYPEINAITTVAECVAALRMGYNCLDNLKPEYRTDLVNRLDAIEDRMRRLIATDKQVKAASGRMACIGNGLYVRVRQGKR